MTLSRSCKIFRDGEDTGELFFFSCKTGAIISVPEHMPARADCGNLSVDERDELISQGFLVESEDAEKKDLLSFLDDVNQKNKKLDVTVVLNLDCNLACKYCFEGKRKGGFYMSRETADRLMKFVRNRLTPEIMEIRVVFYGGEPLLSLDLIEYISERLGTIAGEKGLKFSFGLITNGTLLTVKNVERLKTFGLNSASVTVDGPKAVHDICRPYKSGKGSFDVIVNNLKDVCGLINVVIGGNFLQENYRRFPYLLDLLINHGITPDRVDLVKFDPVSKETNEFAPPDFHDGCESINEPWLFDAGLFLREEILKRGYKTVPITPAVCMIELKNNIVVNYDGSLYKCSGMIGREKCRVGSLKDGISDYKKSHSLDNWKNEECLACAYLPLCFGGCRYSRLISAGNMNGVDCKKPYFDACLEALVKQDIKYGLSPS